MSSNDIVPIRKSMKIDEEWRCSYCGAVNDPDAKACKRCGVFGVIRANPRAKSHIVFGWVVIILFVLVLVATFI